MTGTESAPDVAAFWAAVAGTSPTFAADLFAANVRGDGTSVEFRRVADLLTRVHPDLLLIVGARTGARDEIVISAGGIRQAFGHVLAVVDAAPALVTARYDVRAFRPRHPDPAGLTVAVQSRTLAAGDVRWQATPQRGADPSVCALRLCVPGYLDALPATSRVNQATVEAVFLLLDHLVGEWAVETQIGELSFASDKGAAGLPALPDLPAHLDRISAL